jgi:hypothetical protein
MALLGDDFRPLIGDSVSRYEGSGNFAMGDATESSGLQYRGFGADGYFFKARLS